MEQVKFFVGTDVSRQGLDMSIISGGKVLHHARIDNKAVAVKRWLRQTGKAFGCGMQETLFSLEFTGLYNHHLLEVLHGLGAAVWLVPGLQIRRRKRPWTQAGQER